MFGCRGGRKGGKILGEGSSVLVAMTMAVPVTPGGEEGGRGQRSSAAAHGPAVKRGDLVTKGCSRHPSCTQEGERERDRESDKRQREREVQPSV